MRLIVNALQYKNNSSGIGVLLRELFGRLGDRTPCRVILPKDSRAFPAGGKAELKYTSFSYGQGLKRMLFQSFVLGLGYCRDALLLTTDSKIPLLMPRSSKLVPVITDLAVFRMSEVYQGSRVLLWRLQYRYLCRKADMFIAISEFTRRELIEVLDIPPRRIRVVPCAAPDGMRRVTEPAKLSECRIRYALPDRFLLFVGNSNPRKNLERIIRAFDALKRQHGLPQALVIAGEQGWKFDRDAALKGIEARDEVRFIGFVAGEDLAALYSLADAFVFPTLYEGFGIPVIEAQRCGTPVLTSDTGSMPEVGGAGALYVDPYREEDIARGMWDILTDGELRKKLIREGYGNAGRYSWDRSADELYEAIRGYIE